MFSFVLLLFVGYLGYLVTSLKSGLEEVKKTLSHQNEQLSTALETQGEVLKSHLKEDLEMFKMIKERMTELGNMDEILVESGERLLERVVKLERANDWELQAKASPELTVELAPPYPEPSEIDDWPW